MNMYLHYEPPKHIATSGPREARQPAEKGQPVLRPRAGHCSPDPAGGGCQPRAGLCDLALLLPARPGDVFGSAAGSSLRAEPFIALNKLDSRPGGGNS